MIGSVVRDPSDHRKLSAGPADAEQVRVRAWIGGLLGTCATQRLCFLGRRSCRKVTAGQGCRVAKGPHLGPSLGQTLAGGRHC